MPGRARLLGLVAMLGVGIVVGLVVVARPPVIPADAATAVLARTTTSGPIDPDAGTPTSPGAHSPNGQGCLARVHKGSGWADVCWEVNRDPSDGSPTQDYYQLRVFGSFQGLRWLVARADLVGRPNEGAYRMWPDYAIEGSCRQVSVHFGPTIGSEPVEQVCGRTVGDLGPTSWSQALTWTCQICFLPDSAMKPLATYAFVAVDVGTVPAWDIFVDGGS
jgi:hypothetical protein